MDVGDERSHRHHQDGEPRQPPDAAAVTMQQRGADHRNVDHSERQRVEVRQVVQERQAAGEEDQVDSAAEATLRSEPWDCSARAVASLITGLTDT